MINQITLFALSAFFATASNHALASQAEPLARGTPCQAAAGVVAAGDLAAKCRTVSDEPSEDCKPSLSCHELRLAIRRGCEELSIQDHWMCAPFFRPVNQE